MKMSRTQSKKCDRSTQNDMLPLWDVIERSSLTSSAIRSLRTEGNTIKLTTDEYKTKQEQE